MSDEQPEQQEQQETLFAEPIPEHLEPGVLVWVLSDTKWWPAKIIPLEEMGVNSEEKPGQIGVRFYSSDNSVTMFPYSSEVVAPFTNENCGNSQDDEDIAAACGLAIQDPEAKMVMVEGAVGEELIDAGLEAEAGQRRQRDEGDDDDLDAGDKKKKKKEKKEKRKSDKHSKKDAAPSGVGDDDDDDDSEIAARTKAPVVDSTDVAPQSGKRAKRKQQQQQPAKKSSGAAQDDSDGEATQQQQRQGHVLDDSELISARNDVEAAVQNNDERRLRRLLLTLARARPSLSQLEHTRIGQAVASVLDHGSLVQLQPIAATIIRYWMAVLPTGTKDALRRYAAVGGIPSSVPAPSGGAGFLQQQQQQQQQPSAAAAAAAAAATAVVASGSGFFEPKTKIGKTVLEAFQSLNCNGTNTADNVNAFVDKVESSASALGPQFLQKLLTEIFKESHTELRANLVTGGLALDRFARMTAEELLSPEEKRMAEERREAVAWRAEEGKVERTGNALFECPECGKRNSVQVEVQIRSADEPATIFIECLDCGHNWREGG